jgi:hypothetical protein
MDRLHIRTAIIVLVVVATSPSLLAQTDLTRIVATGGDPFAAIHSKLNDTADSVLAQSIQQMAEAAEMSMPSHDLATPESLIGEFEQHYRPERPTGITNAVRRLDQLRPSVNPILGSEGVPLELASVILVESGGRTNALSPKGALGLWQLMPSTAIRYGLRVEAGSDERMDIDKATRAAARYLNDLYQQFGSWPLALAAYNFGEDRLQRVIDRAGTRDFLQLSRQKLLPQETRSYVPAVLSAMQLLGSGHLPDAPNNYSKNVSASRVFAEPSVQP